MSPLSRRALLRGAGAGALLPAIGACGSVAGSVASAGEIEYWNLFSGPDGNLMKDMTRKIEGRVPGLKVNTTVLDWGAPYYTKLAMASVGGRAPDIAVMHLTRLPGYAPGGLLDPWDMDLLAEFGVRREDINPTVLKRCQYEGKPFAVPLDTHPFIMFYDHDMMDKSGLLKSDGQPLPFESPAHYLEAAEKLRKDNGKLGPVFGHVNDGANAWRLFWTLFSQTGGVFDLTGARADIDIDRSVEVVRFMARVIRPDCRTMDLPTAIADFANGQSPLIFNGEWDLNTFRTAKKDQLGAAPFPTIFDKPAGAADSHSLVLPRQSHVDPAKRRHAHRFAAELLRSSLAWAGGGHIPAYLPVTASKAYGQLHPQHEYAAAANHPALDPQAWFTGSGSDFQNRMCQALQLTLISGAAPEKAVKKMVSEINNLLSKPNPA
ncbi:extracellular solute-binding protein [Streptomyces sp. NPDC051320]|uniref:extracellular solute-binding protein n=1 Tax=Streptomyces sp. NPDC051320 TaxID=3154644 RepID=UPI003448EF52